MTTLHLQTIQYLYVEPLGVSHFFELRRTQGTRPFIAGEMPGQFYYYHDYSNEDDDSFADAESEDRTLNEVAPPTHSFHHDLESLFWILFWLYVCRSGPAMQRTEVFDNPEGDNSIYLNIYQPLFSAASNYQLATNKSRIIKYLVEFDTAARAVSSWCRPLKRLLRPFNGVLRDRHMTRTFLVSDTYVCLQSADQPVRVFLESAHARRMGGCLPGQSCTTCCRPRRLGAPYAVATCIAGPSRSALQFYVFIGHSERIHYRS